MLWDLELREARNYIPRFFNNMFLNFLFFTMICYSGHVATCNFHYKWNLVNLVQEIYVTFEVSLHTQRPSCIIVYHCESSVYQYNRCDVMLTCLVVLWLSHACAYVANISLYGIPVWLYTCSGISTPGPVLWIY